MKQANGLKQLIDQRAQLSTMIARAETTNAAAQDMLAAHDLARASLVNTIAGLGATLAELKKLEAATVAILDAGPW